MRRLFVALRPPPEVRERVLALASGVTGARWQDDAQLHVTLRFIGEVDGQQAEDIALTLGSIRGRPIALELEGVGSFERDGQPSSLWIGVRWSDPLDRLRQAIDRRLVGVGITPERRAFRPHITVARLGRSAGPIEPWLIAHDGLRGIGWTADRFSLSESRLGASGAVYQEATLNLLR